jgi:nuclear autoantigenic sperm protein
MGSSSDNVVAPGDERQDPPPPNPSEEEAAGGEEEAGEEKTLERAEELFDKGSKAIEEGDFVDAVDCLSRALEIRLGFLPPTAPSPPTRAETSLRTFRAVKFPFSASLFWIS